ncbi:MAG: ROK family protein [Lachnospiraceae bacterium]|jgi:fructokinase|nr:ROK family protein [Lachnospiraceae bacterium]
MRLGALEAGGTKMVCAIGDETGKIFEQISIPTITPEETVPKMVEYFKKANVEALGIACFGPIDPDKSSPTYGHITSTPKLPWQNYNIVKAFEDALGCPAGFDTDVNGSVLGEVTFGQAKGKKCVAYATIGTGVGVGVFIEGKLLHGMLHPEAGHVLIQRRADDGYPGRCPFHKNCLEGMAAGPAIEERWGKKAIELKDKKEVWDLEAYYIAQALTGYVLTLSPEMIILGGGVMHQEQLFPMIRNYVKEMLNGYIKTEEIGNMDSYIVPASLNDDQGIMGCLELARRALKNE